MTETKMLKAKCKKTGNYFGLELRRFGTDWKVMNMIPLNEDESKIIASEVSQPQFVTNTTLLPCQKCGNRIVGGCDCSKKLNKCSRKMDFAFSCIYCKELEIDYSRSKITSPYTKWAGTSNIPDAIKDRYGNPMGSDYDLAVDGAFQGYTIIILCLYDANIINATNALKKKGFTVEVLKGKITYHQLSPKLANNNTQLWIISDLNSHFDDSVLELIVDFYNKGNGLYIWGDNLPFYHDANRVLNRIYGVSMYGDSRGDCVLGIQKAPKSPGIIPNHKITTGLVSFYEGITIAEVNTNGVLEPLIYGSNGKVVAAYYDKNGLRAIVDGGFTRLYFKWDTAGTDRYVVNAAAWLTNTERFGYNKK